MKRKLLVIIFFLCFNSFFISYANPFTVMRLNNYNMIYIQLSEVFEDENITLSGTKILDKIYPLIENKQILVEVVCEKSQNHQFSWETANIYGYKIVTYFIKKGINPTSIEYIGYGDIGRTKNLGKNIIKIEF